MTDNAAADIQPAVKAPGEAPAEPAPAVDAAKAAVDATPPSSPDSKNSPPAVQLAGYLELFRFADRRDIISMAVGTVFAMIFGVLQPLIAILLGDVIQAFIEYGQTMVLAQQGLLTPEAIQKSRDSVEQAIMYNVYMFVAIGFAALVAAYVMQSLWVIAGERQGHRVRQLFLTAILRQDVAFFDDNEVGDLTNRLSTDCTLYQEGISEKVATSISALTTFVSGFVIAFIRGWQLTLVLLGVVPFLAAAGYFVGKAIASGTEQSQKTYGKAGSVAQESFANIRTVVAFNGQERVLEKFAKLLDAARKVNEIKAWKTGVGFGIFFSLLYGIYAVAFAFGAFLVGEGLTEGGNILNVIYAIIIGAFSVIALGPSAQAIGKSRGVARKLFAVIDAVPTIPSTSPDGKSLEKLKGRVELRNVTFSYPKRPTVKALDAFSLVIEPGQTVALVGFSGSGKSTIIQLLERFYDPAEGEILLDDVPLKAINVKNLRKSIGLVSQEPILFDTTIMENIRFGVDEGQSVSEEDIVKACKIANAHTFISQLPNGYQTLTGERGSLLSGGQKQRIAIARAILRNPKILLLDEATSALDTESERQVQTALENASKDRTTIVIAHRLSTIKDANKIVVMQDGKIIETGDHATLIAKQGAYADLVRAQELKTQKSATEDVQKDTVASVETDGVVAIDIADTTVTVASPAAASSKSNKKSKKDPIAVLEDEKLLTEEERQRREMERVVKQTKIPLLRILQMQRPEYHFFAIAMFVSILNGALLPLFGVIFGQVLAVFSEPKEKMLAGAYFWSLIFVALMFANFIINLLQFGLFGVLGERLTKRVRYQYFQAMLRQDMSFYDDKMNGTGALTARLSDDAERIQGLTALSMGSLIQLISSMAVAIGLAFYYSWQMTLAVLATVPVLAAAGILETNLVWSSSNDPEVRRAYAMASQTACDAIANIRTVKSLAIEDELLGQYLEKIELPYRRGLRRGWLASVAYAISQAIQFWINAISFYAGYRFVFDGVITPDELFSTLFSITFGAIAFSQAAQLNKDVTKARFAAINFFKLVVVTPTIDAYSLDGKRPEPIQGSAKLQDVQFAYPQRPDAPILRGINAQVPAGMNVSLVGPSGSGKSTVIALLERFYDTTGGSTSVDEVNVKEWNLSYLRNQMSIVSQEPSLFIGTIAENISYGSPQATQQEIEEAATKANIHDFIIDKLPEKYLTPVSNSRLSGGQKQRIAIARALLCNPKILLLDEATSALDSESEKVVQDALNKASEGRTTITIAHRLSTIQNSDLILVIRDGVLVEQGKHFELLEKRGLYFALVEKQKLGTSQP